MAWKQPNQKLYSKDDDLEGMDWLLGMKDGRGNTITRDTLKSLEKALTETDIRCEAIKRVVNDVTRNARDLFKLMPEMRKITVSITDDGEIEYVISPKEQSKNLDASQ